MFEYQQRVDVRPDRKQPHDVATTEDSAQRNPLREMSYDAASEALEPIQARGLGGGASVTHDSANAGISGGGQAAPFGSQIQEAFGRHDIGDVQSHVGGAAGAATKKMGVQAYATEGHVAFGAAPDLFTAAHEYAHHVQQKSGVDVKGGVGSVGDRYEKHADQVAEMVVSGKSAEAKLSEVASPGSQGAAGTAVQMRDTREPIATADAATIARILKALRKGGSWKDFIEQYGAATDGGKNAMASGERDMLVLDIMIAIESQFTFAEGASIETIWDNNEAVAILVTALKSDVSHANKPAEPEPAPVVLPKVGTFGMVTQATTLTVDGSEIALAAGNAVKVVKAENGVLTVLAASGINKEGTLDPKVFLAQPEISNDDKPGEYDNYTYQKYEGDLFLARDGVEGPGVKDVDQGSLGDCFLIAALGSVAASNPQIIKDMVSYDESSGMYTVTFQQLGRGGKFTAVVVEVDSYLPTRRGSGANRTAYAQSDAAFNPRNQALWPAIIEKAYASWKGGYSAIQKGGVSSKAMESITGVRSTREAMPREEDVIAKFKQFQSENKAVVCGTQDWKQQRSVAGLFSGSGDGPYRGALSDMDGAAAEIVKNTVKIKGDWKTTTGEGDAAKEESHRLNFSDDGKGKLKGTGLKEGEIDYEHGSVEFTCAEDKGPASADALVATYRYEGTLSSGLNIHGNHAYIFAGVQGETLLFHNPWGPAAHKHPKPVTAAQFREFFETLAVNATLPRASS